MQRLHPDCWTPVGLESQFPPCSSHPIVVEGYGLAIWRGEGGQVQAWEDRCPHRGMRLSFGFVRGNRLTCLYHGWTYEQEGQCSAIPAHPELQPPKTICATTHTTQSHRGIVYVNLAAEPETEMAVQETAGWHPVRSIFAAASRERVESYFADARNVFDQPLEPGEQGYRLSDPTMGEIVLAVHVVHPGKTALHVACTAASPGKRQALARRLVQMRRELENL